MLRQRLFLILVSLVTIGLIGVILTDWLPWLRGPAPDTAVWSWPYDLQPLFSWRFALLAALLLTAVIGLWLKQNNLEGWPVWALLTALAAGSFFLQLGLVRAHQPAPAAELINRTLAVQTNGYFWTAANIDDLNATLRRYPQAMAAFESDHARTHPPGLVAANWLTIRAFQRIPGLAEKAAKLVYPARCTDLWLFSKPPAVAAALGFWAFFPLLLAAAAVFPAYSLAKKLSNPTNAILAAGFVAALPALLIFAPLPDQIFAFLTLLIMLTLHTGLQKERPVWLFFSGLLLSLATFFSVGNGALLLPVVVYGLLWQPGDGRSRPSRKKLGVWTAVFAAGALSVWLLYWLGWQIPPWEIVQTGLAQHYSGVTNERGYAVWLLFNLIDLFLFSGPPAFIAFILAAIFAMRSIADKRTNAQALALGTAVLIILLLISGSTRGEVGRIWLFLMPLIAVSGGLWAAPFLRGNWRAQWGLFALQLAFALALGVAWKPVGAVIVANPILPDQATPANQPHDFIPVNAQFGDAIRLTQAAIAPTAEGSQLTVALEWQTIGRSARPYTVFVHLLDAEGNLLAQQDGWPVEGQWPPTCWQPGSAVLDQRQLPLPGGAYTLKVGLYDAQTGVRLLTEDGKDSVVFTEIFPTP